MPRTRPPYPPEFRQHMIELVRSGRTPWELAREFEPSAQTIMNWVAQAERDTGARHDGGRMDGASGKWHRGPLLIVVGRKTAVKVNSTRPMCEAGAGAASVADEGLRLAT